ncbi:MAG: hypothetical protein GX567_04020 [Clostridia bacterium]|nr:hypothetical protein [Clostridia bacterium]
MAFQVTGDKYHEWLGAGMLLIFCTVQYLNAVFEEKKKLIPAFGTQYEAYMKHVPHMMLRSWEKILLILALVIQSIGFFIK